MMIGRRVLQCLVLVAGAFLSISAMAASPVGGAGAMGYSCNKVNDASGRWFCKCSGVEDCDRMKEKECGSNRPICGSTGCTCTQSRKVSSGKGAANRDSATQKRAPAATSPATSR